MPTQTDLSCRCGKVHLTVEAEPILAAECECNSCREANSQLEKLPGAQPVIEASGGTHYVLYRKDRITFTAGVEYLCAYRLTPTSPTRRVVAECCNTPFFLEFQSGHWLSIYAGLWPEASRPSASMRTMVSDMPAGQLPPADMPNHKTQSFGFFWGLLTAWAAMRFRSPTIAVPKERILREAA